jgi:uncharacterized Zn-binding protein involved in type VI secretion
LPLLNSKQLERWFMGKPIIREGDPTSHGGRVIEGSPVDLCEGKAMAFVGHKVYCPKCKGTYPIIEGMPTTTVYGKGVALEGMKTACGAALIATQFVTTVGSSSSGSISGGGAKASSPVGRQAIQAGAIPAASQTPATYDLHFLVRDDKAGNALPGIPYRITLETGVQVIGITNANGLTKTIGSDAPVIAKLEAPYYGNSSSNTDSHSEHGACDC